MIFILNIEEPLFYSITKSTRECKIKYKNNGFKFKFYNL